MNLKNSLKSSSNEKKRLVSFCFKRILLSTVSVTVVSFLAFHKWYVFFSLCHESSVLAFRPANLRRFSPWRPQPKKEKPPMFFFQVCRIHYSFPLFFVDISSKGQQMNYASCFHEILCWIPGSGHFVHGRHFWAVLRSWPAIRVLSSWWWWGSRFWRGGEGKMTAFMWWLWEWCDMVHEFRRVKEKGLRLRCWEFLIISNSIGNHSTPLLGCDFTWQVQTATASGEEKDQLAAEITTALTQEPVVGELVSLGAIFYHKNLFRNPENPAVMSSVVLFWCFDFFLVQRFSRINGLPEMDDEVLRWTLFGVNKLLWINNSSWCFEGS